MKVDVCLLPSEFCSERYNGYTAVVIDVLRATTSIAAAVFSGCSAIIPVETVEQAWQEKEKDPQAKLTGERKGKLISGFDLGNSPFEYTGEAMVGQRFIMTTTNGTVALNRAAAAAKVYTAAFVNISAVAHRLLVENQDVVIVCAGTEGVFSLEDAACAGNLAYDLQNQTILSDKAVAVKAMYAGMRHELFRQISNSSHACYLRDIGFAEDVKHCLTPDLYQVVPVFQGGIIKRER
jgi:2-phosphosulfolactate phosphatase